MGEGIIPLPPQPNQPPNLNSTGMRFQDGGRSCCWSGGWWVGRKEKNNQPTPSSTHPDLNNHPTLRPTISTSMRPSFSSYASRRALMLDRSGDVVMRDEFLVACLWLVAVVLLFPYQFPPLIPNPLSYPIPSSVHPIPLPITS